MEEERKNNLKQRIGILHRWREECVKTMDVAHRIAKDQLERAEQAQHEYDHYGRRVKELEEELRELEK